MTDYIYLDDLKIETIIGVYDFEQLAPQPLLISIKVATDLTQVNNDQLEETVNYASLAQEIIDYCQQHQGLKLLETLANGLSDYLAQKFNLTSVYLKINKPQAVANLSAVGIIINRDY